MVKMCFGIEDILWVLDCVFVLEVGGVEFIVVYVCIKWDGYKLLVCWEWLWYICEMLWVFLIVNGEVWMLVDYIGICDVSGCDDVMLGCGVVVDFLLVMCIWCWFGGENVQLIDVVDWDEVCQFISCFWYCVNDKLLVWYILGCLKQWLGLMQCSYLQVEVLYVVLCEMCSVEVIECVLCMYGIDVIMELVVV